MIGTQDRWQGTLFVTGSMEDLIPPDHILRRVDKVLDLGWLREDVRENYCETNGRPGIDPEAAVRLMLAGFFQGIVHDRKLMREAQVNLAMRWFAGYRLEEKLPDHSSLTRIRQRWGAERFKKIFHKTVKTCMEAGLVTGETVHMDATLIRADVSWESLSSEHVRKVLEENEGEESIPKNPGRPRTRPPYPKKHSTTDPDATMATSRKNQRLQPSYKQHTTVDDKAGVIVDVELTTGEVNEGTKLIEGLERVEAVTGKKIERMTADAGYAHSMNYEAMEARGTEAIIPPMPERKRSRKIPLRRFSYDGKHQVVWCPAGKRMARSSRARTGWIYRAAARDCRECPYRRRCLSPSATVRTVCIVDGYEALLRARRNKPRWDDETKRWYGRHRWQAEGAHGEAKTRHGLRRAVRRGLSNVAIQVYLTAVVMNLKRLAVLLSRFLSPESQLFCPQRDLGRGNFLAKHFGSRYRQDFLGLALAA